MDDTTVDECVWQNQLVEVIDEVDLFWTASLVNLVDDYFRANDNLNHVVME